MPAAAGLPCVAPSLPGPAHSPARSVCAGPRRPSNRVGRPEPGRAGRPEPAGPVGLSRAGPGQAEAAKDADQKIQALMVAFQTQCQAEMLNARKALKTKLLNFDINSECEKYAQGKWIELHGGGGQLNLYDRNYTINHTIEASSTNMDGGSAGDISVPISLSAAIISAAYHKSGQLAAADEAIDAAKKAEIKKAQDDALAKKSAAQAAVANRPSAESEESIRKRLTKEIKADCMKDLKADCMKELRQEIKAGHLNLNIPAAQLQSTQRIVTADRGKGRGRGNPGQVNADDQSSRGRGRGRGRGGQAPAQGTHQPTSNSRDRQSSRSPSQQRGLFQSPQPPRTPRTPRASLNSPRRSQTPSGNRGKGGKRGGKSTPRAPSPAAARGSRGRGQVKRGRSPSPRR